MTPERRYPGVLLFPQHEELLQASTITPAVAAARGYVSVDKKATLARYGFAPAQQQVPALLLPVWSALTKQRAFSQVRPDDPRIGSNGTPIKYETPRGIAMAIDAHPWIHSQLGDPTVPLWITEGIRKADSAVSRGLCCLALLGVWNWRGTNGQGGKTALPDWEVIALNGRDVFLAFDSDVMQKRDVHTALARLKAFLETRGAHMRVVYLPANGDGKVGLDDYFAQGGAIDALRAAAEPTLRQCVEAAHDSMATAATIASLERRAAPLLHADDPIPFIERAIQAQGYGGDIRPALLVHFACTTRILAMRPGAMPTHLLLVSPPGAGKNYTVRVNLNLLPTDAYHVIDAGSPRTLIYDDADLRHRVLVFSEADSLPAGEDNPAASAMRNLLVDHHLHYSVTVRDPETGNFTVREIEKSGPTVLITTATRRLGPQLESRLFAVDIPDDQAQIRQALATQAKLEMAGVTEPDPAVIAYQELLQAHAPWDVVVPFVSSLSEALGQAPAAARILRDFGKLLALIKAAAVLRHTKRHRDDRGRLVATVDDYRAVHALLADVYTASTTGAGNRIRQVVTVVAALRAEGVSPVTKHAIAQRMNASAMTAWRHAGLALKGGWLVDKAEGKGNRRPADLDVGDPLPAADGLPAPDSLAVALPVYPDNVITAPETGLDGVSERYHPADNITDNGQNPVRAASQGSVISYRGKPEEAEGRRVWIRTMGELLGWPRLSLRPGEAIAAGETGWRTFTAAPANDELVDRAVAMLLAMEDEGADQDGRGGQR